MAHKSNLDYWATASLCTHCTCGVSTHSKVEDEVEAANIVEIGL